MGTYRKPLKRSILAAVLLFILVLCLILSVVQYFSYSRTLYGKYEEYIENILSYTASGIDVDDLAECIRTGVESEKYHELQSFLDGIRENVSMHFLYIIIPLNTNETDNIQNVIAAATAYEYEFEADELVHLNTLAGDSYSPSTAKKYLDAYETGHLSFFEEVSQWGDDYTGLLPLYDSQGNKVCALCMDVDILEIHSALRGSTIGVIAIVALMGLIFALAFFAWTDVNITRPIKRLETSVVSFARTSHQQRDPEALVLEMPEIHTGNEVESLAHAVVKMSEDMRDYVDNILITEKELARMYVIAHKDGLTKVGNTIAYAQYVENLQAKLETEKPAFAVIMADLNFLKQINDSYGHDKGDLYLKLGCGLICDVFRHSPVFRIGGDEFAVMLLGRDYEDRDALLRQAKEEMTRTLNAPKAEPWERLSLALGMAVYSGDRSVQEVVARADKEMYREKERMKAVRA